MKQITDFLTKNGFEYAGVNRENHPIFNLLTNSDRYLSILIMDKCYSIIDSEKGNLYSPNLDFYWLIGYLTYHNVIDKNYKI